MKASGILVIEAMVAKDILRSEEISLCLSGPRADKAPSEYKPASGVGSAEGNR